VANFPDTRISLILRLAHSSDVHAWQEFADIYAPALHALALRKRLQPADAEDVTQEILFAVARAVERFQPNESRARFRTWLRRIARNLIADFCSGRARRPVSQAISDSWLQAACAGQLTTEYELDEDFHEEYRKALYHLAASRIRERVADKTWLAFERTSIHAQPAETVAAELGISLGSLYVSRCRILKMLRTEVGTLQESDRDADDSIPPDKFVANQNAQARNPTPTEPPATDEETSP